MKIKRFNENNLDDSNNLFYIYESGTFSKNDNNIKNLLILINKLKDNDIYFELYMRMHKTIIYFTVYVLPKNEIEESIFSTDIYNFHHLSGVNTFYLNKQRMIEINKKYNDIGFKKIENDDITEDYIEMLYNLDKFNI